tara:strand:+ start:458 stop:817 length:360 start_codon:yes stop_codon:yes gene_type:complete
MKFILSFFIIGFIIIYLKKTKSIEKNNNSFLNKFKSKFKEKHLVREKLSERYSNSLMLDPDTNITVKPWHSEAELREKADIHRARLNKYGKSKFNGEMLFMGPKGGIYKYNSDGRKKYI